MRINSTWGKLTGSILLMLVLVLQAKAQGPECLFIHFDKSFYVSGETIWFKVYLLNPHNQAKSRVLRVDLVSNQNEPIAQQKLLIENGTSYGSMTLPIGSKEGYYRFRAFTRYNLNFEPAIIYEANIPIYQLDFGEISDSVYIMNEDTQPSGTQGISIVTNKRIYKPRDSLRLSFQVDGANDTEGRGSFSLSIVPSDIAIQKFESYGQLVCPDVPIKEGTLILPERFLFVEGTLRNPNTGQNVSSRLLSIYVDKTSQLIRASSRDGKVKVAVPDYWGPGVFQVLNLDPYNPTVLELIPDSGNEIEDPYFNSNTPHRTPRVIKYLDQLEKRRKIIELFDLYKSGESVNSTTAVKIPDAVYQAEDYKQIYTFEEFINAAIPNVRVRTIDSVKTVRLFNRDHGSLFEDHPWYIVDGFLTFNEREVLQIDYQDINEVRLYSKASTLEKYFHGFMLRSGVMEIITGDVKYVRELKDSPNIVEIQGFASPQDFNNFLTLQKNRMIPDLRGVLYWSPNVITDEQGRGQITIPLSDDTGEFAIVVMGTNHLYQPVTGYHTFEVKLNEQ